MVSHIYISVTNNRSSKYTLYSNKHYIQTLFVILIFNFILSNYTNMIQLTFLRAKKKPTILADELTSVVVVVVVDI